MQKSDLIVLIYQGNVGDSRAIASKKGAMEQLSYDHKPSNDGKSVIFGVQHVYVVG